MSDRDPTRRQYIGGVAVLGVVGLTGCLGDEGGTPAGSPADSAADQSPTDPVTDQTPTATSAPVHPGYETTPVRVENADGDRLGAVTAAIADTGEVRYTGLSETEALPEDRGMLFVYESVADRTFVMREMDFGIDIVYGDSDGTITAIHHAPAPGPDEDGDDQKYPGRGQYVLEVNYGWTTERGVSVGDRLVIGR